MASNEQIQRILDATVIDQNGDKVGKVGQLYLDNDTQDPNWVTVQTGFFGMNETFIPLDDANVNGEEIRVPYTKDFIKDAPNVDVERELTPEEEATLYAYYNKTQRTTDASIDDRRDAGVAAGTAGVAGTHAGDVEGRDRAAERDLADRDLADRDGDGSVVRHEERLNVGKREESAGKVRLKKYVVTEHKTVDVPVSHEEVRLEREPIRDGEAVGGRLEDGEVEIDLKREVPVVEKDVVGVERVGVNKERVTDSQTVEADVAHEEVTLEGDEAARRSTDK